MCGIVGYIGDWDAAPILLDGRPSAGASRRADQSRNLAKSVTVE